MNDADLLLRGVCEGDFGSGVAIDTALFAEEEEEEEEEGLARGNEEAERLTELLRVALLIFRRARDRSILGTTTVLRAERRKELATITTKWTKKSSAMTCGDGGDGGGETSFRDR